MGDWKLMLLEAIESGVSPEGAVDRVFAHYDVDPADALRGAQYARDSFKKKVPVMEAKLAALREQSANLLMVTIPQAEMALEAAKRGAGALDG